MAGIHGLYLNFKTYSKSYKLKKRFPNNPEDMFYLPDTQEAIVTQAQFARVQELEKKTQPPLLILWFFEHDAVSFGNFQQDHGTEKHCALGNAVGVPTDALTYKGRKSPDDERIKNQRTANIKRNRIVGTLGRIQIRREHCIQSNHDKRPRILRQIVQRVFQRFCICAEQRSDRSAK